MKSNLNALFAIHCSNDEGHRFQKELAEFAVENNLYKIVETGSGISSLFFAKVANDDLDRSLFEIYSMDPKPWCNFELEHPGYELIKKKSIGAMLEIFLKTGSWDLALLDGNHDILAQTYELDFAFACLNPGGYLVCDDYTWGPNHNAWPDFIKRNGLEGKDWVMGSTIVVQKPMTDVVVLKKEDAEAFSKKCLQFAQAAEDRWLAAGNKNSDFFKD